MNRILYILGAGFSAPLGLPLVGNFFEKSHRQREAAPGWEHFDDVFSLVRELARAKNYFSTDLFSIEEILSFVALRARLDGTDHGPLLQRYIRDVIAYHTPDIHEGDAGNPFTHAFGRHPWTGFVAFAAAICGRSLQRVNNKQSSRYEYRDMESPDTSTEYAVISLNYDLVLEKAATFLVEQRGAPEGMLVRSSHPSALRGFSGHVAKLHGSIDGGTLVPPTWSKTLENSEIRAEWVHAHHLLRLARQIRVIGYSLPVGDSYVRYLLRPASVEASYFSRFDVLVRDKDKSLNRRYNEFLSFHGYRFIEGSTEGYLGALTSDAPSTEPVTLTPQLLERAHQRIFPDA